MASIAALARPREVLILTLALPDPTRCAALSVEFGGASSALGGRRRADYVVEATVDGRPDRRENPLANPRARGAKEVLLLKTPRAHQRRLGDEAQDGRQEERCESGAPKTRPGVISAP